jgi:hypothetical protein
VVPTGLEPVTTTLSKYKSIPTAPLVGVISKYFHRKWSIIRESIVKVSHLDFMLKIVKMYTILT